MSPLPPLREGELCNLIYGCQNPMTEQPLLDVEDLWVSYDRINAVRGVSFAVGAGEIVTLIGANGAGKSTILRAVSGLLPVARGRISFAGEDLRQLPAHLRVKRGLAHVPEGRGIFGNLTVLENLRLAAYVRRDGEIQSDLEEVFRLFPRLKERRQPMGQHPVGRRAADAGGGPGPDEPGEALAAG